LAEHYVGIKGKPCFLTNKEVTKTSKPEEE